MEPGRRDEPHTPAPTLYPIGFAAGIACVLVGLIVSPRLIAPIGGAIAIVFGFLWVRDATRDYRGVPAPVDPETRREAGVGDAPAVPGHPGEGGKPEPQPGGRFPPRPVPEAAVRGVRALLGALRP